MLKRHFYFVFSGLDALKDQSNSGVLAVIYKLDNRQEVLLKFTGNHDCRQDYMDAVKFTNANSSRKKATHSTFLFFFFWGGGGGGVELFLWKFHFRY